MNKKRLAALVFLAALLLAGSFWLARTGTGKEKIEAVPPNTVRTPPVFVEVAGPRDGSTLERCVDEAVHVAKSSGRSVGFSYGQGEGKQPLRDKITPEDTAAGVLQRLNAVLEAERLRQ